LSLGCAPCRIDSADTRLLSNYQKPADPIRGNMAPIGRFRAVMQETEIQPDNDIPHIAAAIIIKYVTDLQLLGLL
jgi:fatty acid CoA ligase FadD9